MLQAYFWMELLDSNDYLTTSDIQVWGDLLRFLTVGKVDKERTACFIA